MHDMTTTPSERMRAARWLCSAEATMEESDTYLMILEEGEARGIRKMIFMQGEDRLGPPADSMRTRLNEIADLDRLKRIARQVPKAASWQEIVGTL